MQKKHLILFNEAIILRFLSWVSTRLLLPRHLSSLKLEEIKAASSDQNGLHTVQGGHALNTLKGTFRTIKERPYKPEMRKRSF